MDMSSRQWSLLPGPSNPHRHVASAKDAFLPAGRFAHSAVLWRGGMYVFGGMVPDAATSAKFSNCNELWRYDVEGNSWLLMGGMHDDLDHKQQVDLGRLTWPPRNHAHSATVVGDVMYVFGGIDMVAWDNDNAVWGFDLVALKWFSVEVEKGSKIPAGRSYASIAAMPTIAPDSGVHRDSFLLIQGATCDPGCTCHKDMWVFTCNPPSTATLQSAGAAGDQEGAVEAPIGTACGRKSRMETSLCPPAGISTTSR